MGRDDHLIVAALIRRGDEVLLVHQQGPDDSLPSWSLPGGVVEAGELLTEALVREVREETGLEVVDPGRLLYVLQRDDHVRGAQAVVTVFEVAEWKGKLHSHDPDRVILGVHFVPRARAVEIMSALPWRTMREPLVAHLRGEAGHGAVWIYRREGDGGDRLVARLG